MDTTQDLIRQHLAAARNCETLPLHKLDTLALSLQKAMDGTAVDNNDLAAEIADAYAIVADRIAIISMIRF